MEEAREKKGNMGERLKKKEREYGRERWRRSREEKNDSDILKHHQKFQATGP